MSKRLLVLIFSIFIVDVLIADGGTKGDKRMVNLDGQWEFIIDPEGALDEISVRHAQEWRTVTVPGSWQTQDVDLRDYFGVAWYRRSFNIEYNVAERYFIEFDACDWETVVFINEKIAGKNQGGYLPFSFEITGLLTDGSNTIVIRVMDPADTEEGTEGVSLWQVPHGKQSWYLQNSGIWQSVRIVEKPVFHINSVDIKTDLNGDVFIGVSLDGTMNGTMSGDIQILDKNNTVIWKGTESIATNSFSLKANIADPELWNPDSPALYSVEIRISEDLKRTRFGFRKIETRDGKILLNNEPIYMRGALDQDFYPETSYMDPDGSTMRKGLLNAKAIGLNLVRYHMKVPPRSYLNIADELGLLVWVDLPNWDVFTEDAGKRGEDLFNRWVGSGALNHPSLIAVSLINESWGVDLGKEDQRKWLLTFYDIARKTAPDLLVVDNSACWGNFHLKTDINDYHTYWSIPENMGNFTKTVSDIADRPSWLFSPHGDGGERGDEPLIVSEFGNWGLPELPEEVPWWMSKQFQDIEISRPGGVQDRFRDFGYDRFIRSYNDLARLTQESQFRALKWEIEELHRYPEIQGYVITELTDINWEANGVQDIWRNSKIYSEQLNDLQQDIVLIPRPKNYSAVQGEQQMIEIFVSNRGNNLISKPVLNLEFNGKIKDIDLPDIPPGAVSGPFLIPINVAFETVPGPTKINLHLTGRGVEQYARNYYEVFVIPEITGNPDVDTSRSVSFAGSVKAPHSKDDGSSNMIVTNEMSDNILEQLANGSSVLWLAGSVGTIPEEFNLTLVDRSNEWLDGNWISAFSWMRTDLEAFNRLRTFTGLEMSKVWPRKVISGIPSKHFNDVLSGLFIGWVHLNSGSIVQARYGKGKLLICTYELEDHFSNDPMAEYLYNAMLKHMNGPEFSPEFRIKRN